MVIFKSAPEGTVDQAKKSQAGENWKTNLAKTVPGLFCLITSSAEHWAWIVDMIF